MAVVALRPWQNLPAWFGERLREEIPAIAEETVTAIRAEIPDYGAIDGAFGRDLRQGVADALQHFVSVVELRAPTLGAGRELYVALGKRELRAGRTLDALQAAYRVGARVAWRRIAEIGTQGGAGAETVSVLAESVFAYLDEIAAVTVDAFAAAQAVAAGERERRRQRLVSVLLADPPPGRPAIERAAHEASWPLPRTVALATIGEAIVVTASRRMPADHLVGVVANVGCVVVSDPDGPGRRDQLARLLRGASATLGPTVAPEHARHSWARAVGLWRLREAGRVHGEGLLRADDHLLLLLLAEDPTIIDDLERHRLAALVGLAPRSRARLEDTLLAWLRHHGNGPRIAAELQVHPQTVRYRLRRLRDLLGGDLDDPDLRFELEVVLRARRQPITERTSGS
jgi:PucR C-terminal helix-turn-helix domain